MWVTSNHKITLKRLCYLGFRWRVPFSCILFCGYVYVSSVLKFSGTVYVTLRSFHWKINDQPKTTHQISPGFCIWLFSARKSDSSLSPLAVRKCFLTDTCASALTFCLCPPTLNDKVKNLLVQKYCVLPFDIISCQLLLLLCLFLAWSNIILMLCWKKKKHNCCPLGKQSERQIAYVHEHVELSWQLLFLLFYPWSYQHYFPLKQTQCFEVMSSLSPWSTGKLSRPDNGQKGIHFVSEGVRILMCHNFCCQIKHT